MGITTQTKNYSFTSFIQQRNVLNDWDNPFLQQVLKSILKEGYEALEQEIAPYVQKLSTTWREVTDELARPENSPKIRHYNAYNERIDRIIRPLEAVRLTEEIFNGGLFAKNNLPYEGITKRYFLHGNGEAGITCPLACTDGLIALIEAFYKEVPQPVKEIYEHA